jgi:aspartyl-tRNA(Asn)/glutamyl-tRNA(Gln) amidotransferase subunit B
MTPNKAKNNYLATIGVECHVQLKTKTKLFSGVDNDAREASPNTLISQICFGLPGALPVLNAKAIELASRAAFALKTKPQKFSQFDRKHYFYPDLPKGYQITQYTYPIIADGSVEIVIDGQKKKINLTRAHLEEDAGKSTHPAGSDYSLIDLNRAGTPLLEIVSEPEMHSAKEVKAYARELYLIMKYADVSFANLYYGNMRFDVNVSISLTEGRLGTRTETKNLNSFKAVEKAVEYEIDRQKEILDKGGVVAQETRGWDDSKQKTISQRSKEEVHDYRYFPDPDLPPVTLDNNYIEHVKSTMPILPEAIRDILNKAGLKQDNIEALLVSDNSASSEGYIYRLLELSDRPQITKYAANWMLNRDLVDQNSDKTNEAENVKLPSKNQFIKVYNLQTKDNKLNSNNADQLLDDIRSNQQLDPEIVAISKGYIQVSDENIILEIVKKVLSENAQALSDIKNGEMKAISYLVGQVMKQSQGRANPSLTEKLIKKELDL